MIKNFILSLILILTFQSCINKTVEDKGNIADFVLKNPTAYNFNNTVFRKFVTNYIESPENKGREVFTLYIDQRMDTLLFTMWRYPDNTINLENSFGYFYCKGKAVIVYSPFNKIFSRQINLEDKHKISDLYKQELDYYLDNINVSVMWQLQLPYDNDSFNIEKNFNTIINTIKPPFPNSRKKFKIKFP